MTECDDRISRALLKQEIEDFLYREADLLDERRYDEWLGLLTDDVRYWMPMRRNVKVDDLEREFTREGHDISWFDEGKETLTRRVRQIPLWRYPPRYRSGAAFWSTATGSRPRPTSSSASARIGYGAPGQPGKSPAARSCSTRMCC